MRTLMVTLAAAACLGLAAPAAADCMPVRQSGSPVVSADMIDKAQFASSQKKSKKKKSMTKRSSWGG